MANTYFYGHTRRCLVNNNSEIESNVSEKNISDLKETLEFKVWYKLNKKYSKKQQKQGIKYLDQFFYYLPKKLNENNILTIAKIIDLLKDDENYPDIKYIAPLFVSNPYIFIKNLRFYKFIRNMLINKKNLFVPRSKLNNYKNKYGYIYDLFYTKDEIQYEDNLQDVYKIYKTYDLNKKIFPQLKSYDYFSKIEGKSKFEALCNSNTYVCKEYQNVKNYISKTDKDISVDGNYGSYFKLKKIIGYTEFNFTGNSNVIINNRKQLIDQDQDQDQDVIQKLSYKEIQIKNQISNNIINIDKKLEKEIINFMTETIGNKNDIIKKIKVRIKILEASEENKYELNNSIIWTEYYKYNVFFLYKIDETEKNKIKNLFNFAEILKEPEKNFCFYYFENKIFQEIAFEIGKNAYRKIGNELKNAVINNSEYDQINPYNEYDLIEINLRQAILEISKTPPNFNWKYKNITEENINSFPSLEHKQKKLLIKQMDKYGRFNNKNEQFKDETLKNFYSKTYFEDAENIQSRFFTFENTSETNRKVNYFIKSFIGYDDQIKDINYKYDINKLTHKLITKLDQALDTVNKKIYVDVDVDVDFKNSTHLVDKNIFLANGNLGGNDEKLKWNINADNNKKYIIFLQEVLFRSKEDSKEASGWIDEYDYLKSKDSNNNNLSYVNNTEISEDNLLQIRLDKNENIHHGCGILYNENKFEFVRRIKPSYKKIQLQKNKSISNRSTDWIILKVKNGTDVDKHIAVLSVHLQVVNSFFTFYNNLLILQSIKKDKKEFMEKNIPCIIGGDFQNMIYKNYEGQFAKLNIDSILTNDDFTKIYPLNSIDYIFCSKKLLDNNISFKQDDTIDKHHIFTVDLFNERKVNNMIKKVDSGILNFFESPGYKEQLMNTFSNNSFGSTFSIPLQYKNFRNTIINEIINTNIENIEIKKISDNEYGFTKFSYYQRINDNKIEEILSSLIDTKEKSKTDSEGILEYSDLKNINLIDFIKKNKVLKLKVDY
jgi:endonuclease/exonuclease/phosphatase family metal-dependent hydrolase